MINNKHKPEVEEFSVAAATAEAVSALIVAFNTSITNSTNKETFFEALLVII